MASDLAAPASRGPRVSLNVFLSHTPRVDHVSLPAPRLPRALQWLHGCPTGAPEGGVLPWAEVPPLGRKLLGVTALDAARLSEAHAHLRRLDPPLPRRARRWAWDRLRLLQRARRAPIGAAELLDELRLAPPPGLSPDDPLLARALWLHAPNRRAARDAVRVLARWRAELSQIAADDDRTEGALALACLELLRLDGERLAAPLIRWLGTPAHHVPMCRVDTYLRAHLDVVRVHLNARRDQRRKLAIPAWPTEPDAHPDGVGHGWTRGTLAQPGRVRRGRLRLLGVMLPHEVGLTWARWWARVKDATARVRDLAEALRRGEACSRRLWRSRRRLERLRLARPAQGIPHTLPAALRGPLAAHAGLARAAAGALRHVPAVDGAASPRLELLQRWSTLRGDCRSRARAERLMRLIRAWGTFYRHADGALARRARGLIGRPQGPATPFESALLSGRLATDTLALVLRALAEWASDATAPAFPWAALVLLLERGVATRDATHLLREVSRSADPTLLAYDDPVLELCCDLAPREPTAFARALNGLQELCDELGDDGERAIKALSRLLPPDRERLGVVCASVEHGRQLWLRLALLAGLGETLPGAAARPGGERRGDDSPRLGTTRQRDPAWFQRYPQPLHARLRELVEADAEHAEAVAKGQLGRTFPDPADLRLQIRALDHVLAGQVDDPGPLRVRRRRLSQHLAEPPGASTERLRKLDVRLQHRVQLALARRLQASCDAAVVRRLTDALGARPPASWLATPTMLRLLAHLVWLPRDSRRLGLRVLRARLSPQPWNLHQAPANQAFARRMAARGLDLRPWLDEAPASRHRTSRGLRVTLTLSRDPLEVLLMGEPFGTCLSPGGDNFWSSISNAADANKQVLFARDRRGRVHGRCLLALTHEGELVTYHAYAHDSLPGFAALAGAFAAALATQIGTAVAPNGEVETLVANDWYDDGVAHLEGTCPLGPELVADLGKLSAADARAHLERALGPRLRSTAVLTHLLDDTATPDLPGLVAELTPHLLAVSLSPGAQLRAVQTARRSDPRAARALLEPLLERGRWRRLRRNQRELLLEETLTLLGPQAALRLLRRTRPGTVRGWRSESCRRLLVAARARERLQRPARALALYRVVVERLEGADREACRARIEALEDPALRA